MSGGNQRMPDPLLWTNPWIPKAVTAAGRLDPSRRTSARKRGEIAMLFRRVCALLALTVVVLTSGCLHDRWCCRHPCAPRCRPACCQPESCGCPINSGYMPIETVPPPIVPGR